MVQWSQQAKIPAVMETTSGGGQKSHTEWEWWEKKRSVLKPDGKGLQEGAGDPLHCMDAADSASQEQRGLSLHC